MTSTLTYRTNPGVDDYAPSHAMSTEAENLSGGLLDWYESALKARSLQGEAFEELVDAFLDAREDGWDGYGACAVEDGSFVRACELLRKLVARFPAPTASATPHGSLTLEWMVNPRRRLMVSVGDDEQLAYAVVFGAETVQGVATFFRDIPQELSHQLARLYFAAQ